MKKMFVVPAILIAALWMTACERRESEPPTPQVPAQTAPPPSAQERPATAQEAPQTQQQGSAQMQDPVAAATAAGYQIDLEAGEKINSQVCTTCHGEGIAGAPVTGDASAWKPRIEKGMEVLIRHSIEGFKGDAGVMPPRGGVQTLSDDEVASAAVYMVQQVQ